jgi:hypothetical protein
MPSFKVAHLREQGQDMIIVPVNSNFGRRPSSDQQDIIADIQMHARGAGMAGPVCPVWDHGGGRMGYIAPRPWHPFFSSLSLRAVAANINRELSW